MTGDLLSTAAAAARAGLTRRRVDYWVEQKAIRPTAGRTTVLAPAFGNRHRPIIDVAGWSDDDIAKLRAIAAIDRDLQEFGAELRTVGVARLWGTLDGPSGVVRCGAVSIAVHLPDYAEAGS